MELVLRFSNTHASLPYAELRAVLEAEEIPFTELFTIGEYVVLDIGENDLQFLLKRLALTKEYGILLGVYDSCLDIDEKFLQSLVMNGAYIELETIRGFDGCVKELYNSLKKLGIPYKCKDSECKYKIKIVSCDGVILVYRVLRERRMLEFSEREPHKRPVYRPGTMKPILARAYVNLARLSSRRKDTLLDPFCGVGGFAIEACLMGLSTICIDIDEHMVNGAKKNIEKYGCSYCTEIIRGDATKLALESESVDGIATDPPYGRQSVPRGFSLTELLLRFLEEASSVVKRNGCIVFAAPITLDSMITKQIDRLGLDIIEKHLDWVHGSLTRVLYVVKNR